MPVSNLPPVFKNLPNNWDVVRVDNLFTIQQGKQVSKKNRVGNNQKPFLRTKNILWGRIDLSELDEMHFTPEEEKRLELIFGDLLLCEGGAVGRSAIWENQISYCYYQNHLHRLRAINGEIDSKFALFWLWYSFEFGNVYFGRNNVTTIPNMSKSRLGELPFPKPKIEEQRKIAALLSAIQLAVAQQERMIALTTELKKALMHKLFAEGTRSEPQKQTEIGPMPESWKIVQLGELLIMTQYGLSVKGTDIGNYPILRMTNQVNGKILPKDLQMVRISEEDFMKFKVETDDILFNRTNSFDLVGRSAIFDIKGDFVFASYLIRLRVERQRLNPFFLNYYLNWDRTQQRLKGIATRAVSQSNISATRLRGFEVPLPPIEIQQQIVVNLDIVTSKIILHEKRKERLQDLFRTLLHQLMTAQIRIHDVDLSELGIENESFGDLS